MVMLKNDAMLETLIPFDDATVRRNARKHCVLVLSTSWYRLYNSSKLILKFLLKNEAWNKLFVFRLVPDLLACATD